MPQFECRNDAPPGEMTATFLGPYAANGADGKSVTQWPSGMQKAARIDPAGGDVGD